MKKVLIFIMIFMSLSLSSYAENINECKTDIYYGNGVWNEYEDADDSRKKLEVRIVKLEIIDGDTLLQLKYGETKLAYNTSFGKLGDVLEVYYQLKEAGQLDSIGFYAAIAALTIYQPEITLGAIATQKLTESLIQEEEEANVAVMWENYYHESFKLGHRVLLVSHSQGNLFANHIHEKINPREYRKYFANVQVASPASEVKAEKGSYVTLVGDPIINPIPGSMGGNANGSPGHAFVEAYLNQIDSYIKIVNRIKGFLPTLDTEISQWENIETVEEGTCDYRIKVKHSFDVAVYMPFDVYMFAPQKLYQVNGEEWVMASCGGKNILGKDHEIPTWDGKKDNECYMIDNLEEEKIWQGRFIRDDEKEVVLDTNTSLIWQDNSGVEIILKGWVTWENHIRGRYFDTSGDTATSYCEDLTLGDYSDWRLPSIEELKNLNPTNHYYHEILEVFKYNSPHYYWSSTTYALDSSGAWIILFFHRRQYVGHAKSHYDGIRCVRTE